MTDPFTSETTIKTDNPDQELSDLLAQIKNDKGEPKYADVTAALKALKESQEFIPTILSEKTQVQKELEEYKTELEKRKTLEELTETLKSNTQQPKETLVTPEAPTGVAKEDVESLLEQKLNERETIAKQASNLKSVVDQLTSKFGDKTTEHIQKVAEQSGTSVEELKKIASQNPTLALRLLDTDGSQSAPLPNTSTQYIQREISEDNKPPAFEKGAARGGMTNKELQERWKEVARYTNKRLGVES